MPAFFLALAIFVTSSVQAYVPDHRMILDRTSAKHGWGVMLVEQDILFTVDDKTYSVRERWFIKDEKTMRLEVRSNKGPIGFQINFVYNDGQRYFMDQEGVVKVSKANPSRWEPYFHFRRNSDILERIVAAKILPADALKPHEDIQNLDEYLPKTPEYLRLARVGGRVTYAFGYPTAPGQASKQPGLWIDQDEFVVRRIRFDDGSEVTADKYSRHPRGLYLPSLLKVDFDNQQVQIEVRKVQTASATRSLLNAMSRKGFDKKQKDKQASFLPDIDLIKEFYRKFR